ncbi:MAG TPA: protein-disulfide reductase DsbD [Moraxellaceae bacterium]|nr:protein-disulfide reductase DsbD [Moraxellaceae bacterium]
MPPLMRFLGLILLLVLAPSTEASLKKLIPGNNQAFLPAEEALRLQVTENGDDIYLEFQVMPGHYLYKNRIRFEPLDTSLTAGEPIWSLEGEWKDDPSFGRVPVYHENVTVTLPMQGSGRLKVVWQGCADAGLCYPPQDQTINYGIITSPVDQTATQTSIEATLSPATTPVVEPVSTPTSERSSLWLMLGAGLLLAFTPCVLPMLPILAGIIARQHTSSSLRGFLLALFYVLGVATTYALTGATVGMLGAQANLPLWFQHPLIIAVFAAFFIALALSLFGLFELRLPQALHGHLDKLSQRPQGGALFGSWVMGMLSALVVSPCVSAPLAGVLLHISSTGDAVYGATALFLMAMGMGVPLLILGATEGRLLPKAGAWMDEVKTLFGFALLIVAAELVTRLLPAPAALAIYATLTAAVGLWLWGIGHPRNGLGLTIRGISVASLFYAAALMVGAASGGDDPFKPLARFDSQTESAQATPFIPIHSSADLDREIALAKSRGQVVMLDFYADWCVSCKIMERQVFREPRIAARLGKLHLLQADITANTAEDRKLLKRFTLFGPPAMLFFGSDGNEITSARLVGEKKAEEFLIHLNQHDL